MYKNIKSYVLSNRCITKGFNSQVGVRQGENMSPLLFALYVNDLHVEDFLALYGATGVELNCDIGDVEGFAKLLVLIYADDTVILADTAGNLQRRIDGLSEYCLKWKLTVNSEKNKNFNFFKEKTKKSMYEKLCTAYLGKEENYPYR
jgi:hypothetical protein